MEKKDEIKIRMLSEEKLDEICARLDTMHWGPGYKVSSFLFLQNETSVHKCEHFMEVQGIHA